MSLGRLGKRTHSSVRPPFRCPGDTCYCSSGADGRDLRLSLNLELYSAKAEVNEYLLQNVDAINSVDGWVGCEEPRR